ncbi:hypothetical protein [Sodaliphilus sp.]|uniref:hypothetical protein n=1 Tax=Sodaliphilus sp. TaxID=2815818 RepID=UPI00388EEC95
MSHLQVFAEICAKKVAIYDLLTEEVVGATLAELWQHNIKVDGAPVSTGNCIISKHSIYRKKQTNK